MKWQNWDFIHTESEKKQRTANHGNKVNRVVDFYCISIFCWYISKLDSFDGIYLTIGSFDGIDPIFP